ncbi:coq1 putative hexaprenyl diphosphate synthase [Thecaphora frezii]
MPPRFPASVAGLARSTPRIAAKAHGSPPPHSCQSTWATAVDQAKNLVQHQLRHLPSTSGTSASSSSAPSSSSPLASSSASSSSFFGTPGPSTSGQIITDPLSLVSSELSSLRSNLTSLLGSGHPSLDTIAKYYFQAEGKHVRPLIVLLMSKATNGLSPLWPELLERAERSRLKDDAGKAIERDMGINEPLSPDSVLNDFNPHMGSIEGSLGPGSADGAAAAANTAFNASPESIGTADFSGILPTQRRLAEITEMIHVASLLHDDVIDASPLRRGAPSAPSAFGNKLSILGGDFLLGRASVALARLRDNEVVELLATVIANLVEGEVMQLKSQAAKDGQEAQAKSGHTLFWESEGLAAHNQGLAEGARAAATSEMPQLGPTPAHFSLYLQKTYLKTAALIGKSVRASTILGGCGAEAIARAGFGGDVAERMRQVRDAAYGYGRNLGIAFQLVDDLLDFEATSAAFGKPSGGADLRLGLATAPVLYTWQEVPNKDIAEMVARRFEGPGDVEKMLTLVSKSRGLERTAQLAKEHARRAREALDVLPSSEAREALIRLNDQVIKRVR